MLLAGNIVYAQHQEVSEKPGMWKGKHHTTADTTSLLHAFKTGSFHPAISGIFL